MVARPIVIIRDLQDNNSRISRRRRKGLEEVERKGKELEEGRKRRG